MLAGLSFFQSDREPVMDKTWADAAITSSSLPPRLVNAVTVTTPTAEATTDDAVPHAPLRHLVPLLG